MSCSQRKWRDLAEIDEFFEPLLREPASNIGQGSKAETEGVAELAAEIAEVSLGSAGGVVSTAAVGSAAVGSAGGEVPARALDMRKCCMEGHGAWQSACHILPPGRLDWLLRLAGACGRAIWYSVRTGLLLRLQTGLTSQGAPCQTVDSRITPERRISRLAQGGAVHVSMAYAVAPSSLRRAGFRGWWAHHRGGSAVTRASSPWLRTARPLPLRERPPGQRHGGSVGGPAIELLAHEAQPLWESDRGAGCRGARAGTGCSPDVDAM